MCSCLAVCTSLSCTDGITKWTVQTNNTRVFNTSKTIGVVQGESAEEKAAKSAAKREARMQSVLKALGVLASTSGVSAERQTFMDLVSPPVAALARVLPTKTWSPPSQVHHTVYIAHSGVVQTSCGTAQTVCSG